MCDRSQNQGFCLQGVGNTTISIGDDGSPTTFKRRNQPDDNREYLAGIAAYRDRALPTDLPAKYVRASHFLSWLLRDYSIEDEKPIREEVYNCLVNPPDRADIPAPRV